MARLLSPATLAAGSILLFTFLVVRALLRSKKTSHIPSVRYGRIPGFRSWQGAYAFLSDPEATLKEGSERYPDGCFKVSTLTSENIVVSNTEKLAEYLAAPDSQLNVQDAINEGIQFRWTMGAGVYYRPYHIPIVRGKLTQNVANIVPAMQEEISGLLDGHIGQPEGWKEVPIHNVTIDIIAKIGNLALAGPDVAHNQAYIDAAIQYTLDLMISAEFLRPLPVWAKEFAAYLTPAYRSKKKCEGMIGGYITKRLRETDAGAAKAQDMLQWLIDTAPPEERTMPQLNERLLALNVAAIHTTTMTLTNAIYTLCSEPDKYLQPLREEVRQHCPDGQFTKERIDSLHKLDSFFRECGRIGAIGTLASGRQARSDFTFKDGTVIPKGYMVSGSIPVLHKLLNAEEAQFDGFKYSRLAEEGKKRMQSVSTSNDYLAFGHGRHACPGRFFAASEMKQIFANLILRYDMKVIPGTKAMRLYIGAQKIPETKLKILMKRV
ncbi:hypothetical protein LTR62_005482 [Meristemomyces frigidus]|uniref:Cytochrome P450 n=1 Tax=Meristemomyces frigidus TaxID=1508187 RepID=A0AAN7YNI3_9PEZI|nr:hypothetical protein LTR62_005482 [Meristemomyces frigidus]